MRVVASGSSLTFYINGTPVWSGSDSSLTSGRVGLGFYADATSGNQLWADYATLTTTADADGSAAAAQVSAEQRAANEAANRSPTGNGDTGPVSSARGTSLPNTNPPAPSAQ